MNKLKLKQRFLAGLLAISMSGATTSALALQEENTYNGETTKIEQTIDENTETVNPEDFEEMLSQKHAHKYVSLDGSEERWFRSEEKTLGDYHWTEETMKKLDYYEKYLEPKKKENPENDFYDLVNVYMLFCRGGNNYVLSKSYKNDKLNSDFKCQYIYVKLSDKEIEILEKLDLMSVSYNLDWIKEIYEVFGKDYYAFFNVEIKEDKYVVNQLIIKDINEYIEKYMGEHPYMSIYGIGANSKYKTCEFEVPRDIEDSKVLINKVNGK